VKKALLTKVLTALADKHAGVLTPEAVVETARDPKNPLHSEFEWDDTKAAEQYRLDQARELIRVAVTVVPHTGEPVRTFVSLVEDRRDGHEGGYRKMISVMATGSGRAAVLETALWELDAFRRKYAHLKELCKVFDEFEKLKKKSRKKHR
jgi:hypothetical protein